MTGKTVVDIGGGKDAFGNWIIKVQLSEPDQLKDLMDAKGYEDFCNKQQE